MQVPTEFVQDVMPRGELSPQQVQAGPADFGAQVGHTLQQSGSETEQQAIIRQQTANETAANDVYASEFLPAFQKLYGDFYALQGKNAVDQRDSCLQSMQQLRAGTRDTLSNPMQQRLFDSMARRTISMEQGAVIRYAEQQNKVWQAQASDAAVAGFTNITADKYNDPQRLQSGLTSIANEIARYGALAGQSEEVVRERTDQAWDRLYRTIIERQALDPEMGPQQANATFEDGIKRGFISGGAQLFIARYLKPSLNLIDADRAYETATGGAVASKIASAAARAGIDPKTALTIASIESGLNPGAQNPESSAHGLFQHLDSTWAALGGTVENRNDVNAQIDIGIKGIEQDRGELAAALKRRPQPWEIYLAHEQGVKGAEDLISADPNAKAASIVGEKAIVQNGADADTTVAQFLDRTQNLFSRKSMLFTGGGQPTAQNIEDNFESGLNAVSRLAEHEHPGDPEALERYRSFYIQQAGETLRAQQMTDRANREMLSSGLVGASGAKSWGQFLADPERAQAYADACQTDPETSSRVDGAISANALDAWDPPASDETDALYKDLKGMQTTDRTGFEDADLLQYYGKMPATQLNELLNDQAQLRRRDAAADDRQTRMIHALSITRGLFLRAGYTPGAPFPEEAAGYNRAVANLGRALDTWRQNNADKVPTDPDILHIAHQTLFPEEPGKAGALGTQPYGKDRDPFDTWIAGQLQAAGKAAGNDTIDRVRAELLKQNPDAATEYNSMRIKF